MWSNPWLPFSWTGATTTTIVPASTDGRCTGLVGLLVMVDGTTDITVLDGATIIAGPIPHVAGGGWLFPILAAAPPGSFWAVGTKNTAFRLQSSAAVKVGGMVLYRKVGEQ